MTTYVQARQPFGVLDESRLQALTSLKNRQNNIPTSSPMQSFKALKSPASAPVKKRLASDLLADEYDSENIDPSLALSPSKRSKTTLDTPIKAPMFVLQDAPMTAPSKLKTVTHTPTLSTSALRGSLPQNKRVSLLSSSRRIKTPFRRIDPLHKQSPMPFSIDAALSGTISSYTPASSAASPDAKVNVTPTPVLGKKSSKSMPGSWFFDIHEDTPEQEATNMMEHCASTLDISSDDDAATSRAKDSQERGKENVPPPDWNGPTRSARSASRAAHRGIKCPKKAAKYAKAASADAMAEDRAALRDLDVTVFCDEEQVAADPSVKPEVHAAVCQSSAVSVKTEVVAVLEDSTASAQSAQAS